jgi:hypothetical protein
MATMTYAHRIIKAGARALWEDWRTQPIASSWARDTTWDDLLRWSVTPDGEAADKMVAAGRSQSRACLAAVIAALMEPSEEMMDRGNHVSWVHGIDRADMVWRAMLSQLQREISAPESDNG